MKTNKHTFRIAALSTVFALGIGLIVNINKQQNEVDAYSVSSLPSTIDLNDCSEATIRSYYSDLDSLSTSERQGTNLLKNLKPILKRNQKYYSYDESSNNKIWQIYEISDRDWEKSPANEITSGSYNSSTNKITNYTYNSDNPYLHALYVNRNTDNQTRAWGDHGNSSAWGMNREHIWAKSHGFQADGSGGARGDLIHLWAANGYANNIHSNNFYGFVDKTQTYTNCGSKYSNINNNLSGKSKNAGGSQTIFEPQDCDKGDIARAIFYMAARYNYYSGSDSDGIGTNNPNLVIANNLSENGTTGTSTTTQPYAMGLLSDLLAWNKLDPVDEYEIHRNNLLYKNYTNNRNPFIDFPEWADAIWGTANLDGTNYNSTVTTYATPASDPLGSSTITPVFTISNTQLNLEVGGTANISASNADGNISWSVTNGNIASLNRTTTTNGQNVTVTALSAGTTTITATNGSNSLTCNLTVTEQALEISLNRNTASVEVGQTTTLVAAVTPNNAQVTWLSSDEDVATVSNGVVTGVSAGTAVITAKLSDSVKAQCTVTVTSNGGGGNQSSLEIATSISTGDTVYLTANSANMQFNGISSTSTKYGLGVSFDDEPNTDTYALEVNAGINNGTYAFKIKEGNNANKYLSWTSSNSLTTDSNIDMNSSWIVDFDNAGNATIANSSDSSRVIWWNVGSPRFACYIGKSNGDGYKYTQLWKLSTSTVEYVEDYLDSVESVVAIGGNESTTTGTQTETNTLVFENAGLENGENVLNVAIGSVTLNSSKGTNSSGNSPKYYTTGKSMRIYPGNTFTFTSSKNITEIVLTFSQGDENDLSVSTGTLSGNTWSGNSTSITFESVLTSGQTRISRIEVSYDGDEIETLSVDHAYMEFGITIPTSDWDAINANDNWEISDYGVMFVKKTTLEDTYGASSVEEAFYNGDYLNNVHKGNGDDPYEILDMYIFTAKLNVNKESNYDVVYCAASYIVVNDTYYFLREERESIRSLAAQSIGQGTSELSDDALTILKGNYGG